MRSPSLAIFWVVNVIRARCSHTKKSLESYQGHGIILTNAEMPDYSISIPPENLIPFGISEYCCNVLKGVLKWETYMMLQKRYPPGISFLREGWVRFGNLFRKKFLKINNNLGRSEFPVMEWRSHENNRSSTGNTVNGIAIVLHGDREWWAKHTSSEQSIMHMVAESLCPTPRTKVTLCFNYIQVEKMHRCVKKY